MKERVYRDRFSMLDRIYIICQYRNKKQKQMKQNIPVGINAGTSTTKGLIRYSDRYKDILERVNKNHEQQKPKNKFKQQYFFYRVRSIGVGAFSFVYLVEDENSGTVFAQKSINKKTIAPELSIEIKMHFALSHQNIVNLYHIYSEEGYVHLIMEYAGESLFSLRKNGKIPYVMAQQQIVDVLGQLINAVSYLHGRGIVHADIKLQNILYQQGVIKLCDFGYAHINKGIKNKDKSQQIQELDIEGQRQQNLQCNTESKQVIGTLEYLDPQYVQGKVSEFSRDIWAIGIVAYQLLVGRNPFDGMPQNQKWSTILKMSYINTKSLNISQEMQTFLSSMLCPMAERASIQELYRMPMFRKQCSEPSYMLDENQIKVFQ